MLSAFFGKSPPPPPTTAKPTPRAKRPSAPAATATYYWSDIDKSTGENLTDAVGWLVLDRRINGVSGGGIFMHHKATKEETAAIAANMTRKFTVCDPQIGGAKAGIRFDHRDPRAKDVLRRFLCYLGNSLKEEWVTAGDLNTDDAFIEKVIQEDIGLPTCQYVLGRKIAEAHGWKHDLCGQLAKLIPLQNRHGIPLIEAAVGNGVFEAMRYTAQDLCGDKGPLRLVIQGFGAVGSGLALQAEAHRDFRVVSVSGAHSTVTARAGHVVPVRKMMTIRHERSKKSAEEEEKGGKAPDPHSLNVRKDLLPIVNAMEMDDDETVLVARIGSGSARMHEARLVQDLQHAAEQHGGAIDVFAPCATRFQITPAVAQALLKLGTKYLVPGANNPFGVITKDNQLVEDTDGVVQSMLQEGGVVVVPDWVANSGTAQLFHRGLSVDFDASDPDQPKEVLFQRVLQATAKPIRNFLREAFAQAKQDATLLATACHLLAEQRIEAPRPFVTNDDDDQKADKDGGEEELMEVAETVPASVLAATVDERDPLLLQMQVVDAGTVTPASGGAVSDPSLENRVVAFDEEKLEQLLESVGWQKTPSPPLPLPPPPPLPQKNERRMRYGLPPLPAEEMLSVDERYELIMKIVGATTPEECITRPELYALLRAVPNLVAYDGFEPSGLLHVAQVLLKKTNVDRWTDAGGTFLMWIADYFGYLNGKGTLEQMRVMGRYFMQVWKAFGINTSRVKFLWCSEEIERHSTEYREMVLRIGRWMSLKRGKRCLTALGREEEDENLVVAQLQYAVMQIADVFLLGVDACQLGVDQRKINMAAREFAASPEGKALGLKPPVVLSHPMLPGLKSIGKKMSKSKDADCAVFVEDSPYEIARKLKAAYCPPGTTAKKNPVLRWTKDMAWDHLVQPSLFHVPSSKEAADKFFEEGFGFAATAAACTTFLSYEAVERAYVTNNLHPLQLKAGLAYELIEILAPIRRHFEVDPEAKSLLKEVQAITAAKKAATAAAAAAEAAAAGPEADEENNEKKNRGKAKQKKKKKQRRHRQEAEGGNDV